MDRNFIDLLTAQWEADRLLSVGLDTDVERIPACVNGDTVGERMYQFNCAIVDATHDVTGVFKPNIAFYAGEGVEGLTALIRTVEHIREVAPEKPVVLDAKRADIGKTNRGYVREAFEVVKADAVTVHPYLGCEAMAPFLARRDKGIIVLARTSNPGAGEFQDLHTLTIDPSKKPEGMSAEDWLIQLTLNAMPLYQRVANQVASGWNGNGNCSVVVGATYPDEAALLRAIVPDLPFLIPGVGAQSKTGDIESDVEQIVLATINPLRQGWIIVKASSSVTFASNDTDFAAAARAEAIRLSRFINQSRAKAVAAKAAVPQGLGAFMSEVEDT